MDTNKLSDIIKSTAKVNLSYSATALNLSKDYLKAISKALDSNLASNQTATADTTNNSDTSEAIKRVPLIVAGRKGETANAAVAVNNTSGMNGTVTLKVNGHFSETIVKTDPEKLSLKAGESTIVRILAYIDTKLEVDKDYPGIVIIPELELQVAEFVVRRLPDLAEKPIVSKKNVNTKKSNITKQTSSKS